VAATERKDNVNEHPARVAVRGDGTLPGGRGRSAVQASDSPSTRARRAVVLSGGGAKGVFESGVLHAFAQVGLEPQVLTGSSVGAVNAVAFAEVLRARREEGEEAAQAVLERALHLWQGLDRERVADLDAWGWRVWGLGIGAVLVGLLVAWLAAAGGWSGGGGAGAGALLVTGRIAGFAIGLAAILSGLALLRLWTRMPGLLRGRVRSGLGGPSARGVPDGTAGASRAGGGQGAGAERADPVVRHRHFLLGLAGLTPALFARAGLERALARVVPAARLLSEYRACGLDVRLTRTNVRTGRTEVSEHLTAADADRLGVDRGRRVLGDPRALPAALASSAFPAAFPPVAASEIYPEAENPHLYAKLAARAVAKQELHRVFGPHAKAQYLWLMSWLDDVAEREPELLAVGNEALLWERLKERFRGEHANWLRMSGRALFTLVETRDWPQLPLRGESAYGDRYFDGGILDNTPLSTALAALRDAEARHDVDGPAPDPVHEIFVVLLAPRPRRRYLSARDAEQLAGPALGMRALRLQAEHHLADDVRTAEKIDRLLADGRAAEAARESGAREAAAAKASAEAVVAAAAAAGAQAQAETWSEIFARERGPDSGADSAAPAEQPTRWVRAVVTRVQPSWDLPWVLALDDRLGFERTQAREFQARGCRDALLALHARHAGEVRAAGSSASLPAHAQVARQLVGGGWRDEPRAGWVCSAVRCSLRADCDRVAEREARVAGTWAAEARPTEPRAPAAMPASTSTPASAATL
jgi:predicted acylesterase/phospholipase RssA